MPKKGNYNQDYYKLRGKAPGNEDVLPERERQEYELAHKANPFGRKTQKDTLPKTTARRAPVAAGKLDGRRRHVS
jgi:hypothetical protein